MTQQVFLKEIAARFFQINGHFQANAIGDGNINDTYRIDFEEFGTPRTFLLQRLNHLVFRQPEAVMANWQAVAAHLAASDFLYKIPVPVPARSGELLLQIPGEQPGTHGYWRVFPFFENTFSPEKAATPALAFEAAKAYGAFLRALSDFPAATLAETIPGFHDTDRRWICFEEILAKDPADRRREAAPEIAAMLDTKTVFDKIGALKRSGALPLRATHNDTKAGNVLLDKTSGLAVAVIDWDTVMPGTALSDFGDMMRSFAPDRPEADPDAEGLGLRLEVVEAMCRGFLAEAGGVLVEVEKTNLVLGAQWIIGEQALRFLTDFLAGDVYYKTAHPRQNLERTRNQLALLRRVGEAAPAIEQFLKIA